MSQATATAAEPAEVTRKKATKKKLLSRAAPEDDVFIHISGNDTKVQYREGSTLKTKLISLEDLATAMNTDLMLDTGLVSVSGRDYCGLRQYIKKGSAELIVQELSAGTRDLRFRGFGLPTDDNDGVSSRDMECPFVIGMAKFVDGRHQDSWVYTSKLPILSTNTELFTFPFGNVYNGENRICWGNLSLRDLTKQNFLIEFIQSNFNSDLGQHYNHHNNRFNSLLRNNGNISYDDLSSQGRYSRVVEQKIGRL